MDDLQSPFDVAVVIPTILRPQLERAVNSVFDQDLKGRIQILIGVDVPRGDRALLTKLQDRCPSHVAITVLDPGYSTSKRNGGLYDAHSGGALRIILSYAANSRYISYLDDDNWLAPYHLRDLVQAIQGHDWAFSHRWFVDPDTKRVVLADSFVSVGPGKGVMKEQLGGFVDTNCYLIDKLRCHQVLPLWSTGGYKDDVRIYKKLSENHSWGATGRPSVFYEIDYALNPPVVQAIAKLGLAMQDGKPQIPDAEASGLADGIDPYRGKIFLVGLQDTGCRFVYQALGVLGYRYINVAPGQMNMDVVEDYDVLVNLPIAVRYRELDRRFPGSRFILTTRDTADWLEAASAARERLSQGEGQMVQAARRLCDGLFGQWRYNESMWREGYERHYREVEEYFRGRPGDLLTIDPFRNPDWKALCEYLGHPRPAVPFPGAIRVPGGS